MKIPSFCIALLCCISIHSASALQNLFKLPKFGNGGNVIRSTPPLPMQNRVKVGTLSISPMGLGTLNLPLDTEEDETTTEVIKTAVANNVNFVDTAEAYGFGKSETLTRNSILAAGLEMVDGNNQNDSSGAHSIVVATKFAPIPWRTDPESVVKACQASANRLDTSKIPLYQIHFPDIIQPFKSIGFEKRKDELYWDGIAKCYEMGLVENVGVSNYGPEYLLRAQEALSKRNVPIASNQINFSLARFRSSLPTVDMCDEMGIAVLAYFPLANGLLAGKYSEENPPKFPKSLTMKKYYDSTKPLLSTLQEIADDRGKTMAQVSINWVMMKGAVPIPGARNSKMAQDNFGALGWALTADELSRLNEGSMAATEFSSGGFNLE